MFARLTAFVFVALAALPAGARAQGSPSWQQRVAYTMDVRMDTERHHMAGRQRLVYYNNSPDTLEHVFYHLYFNAFNPRSMMAARNRVLPDPDGRLVPRIFELGPDEVGYHRVLALTQDGRAVPFEVNDTVLRARLPRPLLPGDSTVFEMRFQSQVPLQTRRSGRDNAEGVDYSMSQWYPKMAAYDERGWHADPYVGREFYAPFGSFDVRITLPARYVVGGTGVVQNPQEVGHGYAGATTPAGRDSLTWHFRADDVHDFAWAADPDYLHDEIEGSDGVTYHLLYLPDVADTWKPMRQWVPQIIQAMSRRVGPYPYPQFTVAQAGDGGMEYPMVNFVTGRRSPGSLLGVTIHEAAHEWFYGALGSNEADYAWMDEGFTSWLSAETSAALAGRRAGPHTGSQLSLVVLKDRGLFERLNTPSDWFESNTAYGTAAYSGGDALADVLGYVISDSLRDVWVRRYFEAFRFRHPNPYDVERVAEQVSGLQLDWLFEQWLNDDAVLDYAVEALASEAQGGAFRTTITLEREGRMVMPVDLRLTLADGTTQWVNVPLSIMEGHKPVPAGWIVAEPWFWTEEEHTVEVTLPQRVVRVEIDPLGRTPEQNRLNNTTGFPLQARFLAPPQPTWFTYGVGWRPLGLYADAFGPGAGVQARGVAFLGHHQVRAGLTLWPQVLASGGEEPHADRYPEGEGDFFNGIDYELGYRRRLGPLASLAVEARKHLGILENTVRYEHPLGRWAALGQDRGVLGLQLQHQANPYVRAFEVDDFNAFIGENLASFQVDYRAGRGLDVVAARLEVGASLENLFEGACLDAAGDPIPCALDYRQSATRLDVEAAKAWRLGPLTARAHARLGVGTSNLALHKRYRLGAASFEEAWRSDAFRQLSSPFENALADVPLAALRGPGPVAYLLAAAEDIVCVAPCDVPRYIGGTPIGSRLVAGSLLVAAAPLREVPALSLALFSGVGQVWSPGVRGITPGEDAFAFDRFLADAGVAASLDVGRLRRLQRWTAQSDVLDGLRVDLRLPLWASDPERLGAGEDAVAFRWLLGIQVGL